MLHSHPAQSNTFQEQPHRAWPRWPLLTLLSVLFLGPIIAPLFQATRLPLIADSGALARDVLSLYVCPTPAKSYVLLSFPMAVCARCWGATIGLWLAWLLLRLGAKGWRLGAGGQELSAFSFQLSALISRFSAFSFQLSALISRRSPFVFRLLVCALPFLLWPLEIILWPAAPLFVLLINGALAGLSGGLFLCSIWPGLWTPRSTTASSH
jgi:hypothetical protein